jgi:hypothetical protein
LLFNITFFERTFGNFKKLEIEELEILDRFLIGCFFAIMFKKLFTSSSNCFKKKHVLHQHDFSMVSLQKNMVYLIGKLDQKPILLTFGQFDHLVILAKSI